MADSNERRDDAMGRSIFISYKYGDNTVHGQGTIVRDYVDELQRLLDKEDHVNKGEADDTDLSQLTDDTIHQKLVDRMFDSTVTIVIISPNMKEANTSERNQWIPWEVSCSLRTENREADKSNPNAMIAVILPDSIEIEYPEVDKRGPNAMIAVVLPDVNGSYEYYVEEHACKNCDARTIRTDKLFPILKRNMFNIKNPKYSECTSHEPKTIFSGESHYIESVKWDKFKANVSYYIDRAIKRQSNWNDYQINTQLEQ